MGRVTGTFYRLYGRAKRVETIVLTNLMFETIGSTTYRLALREVGTRRCARCATILTRDESFHVPLNVSLPARGPEAQPGPRCGSGTRHLRYDACRGAAQGGAPSCRRALAFDLDPSPEVLASAYAEHLGRLFVQSDLDFYPPELLLRLFGHSRRALASSEDPSAVSVPVSAEAVRVDRERVVVSSARGRASPMRPREPWNAAEHPRRGAGRGSRRT